MQCPPEFESLPRPIADALERRGFTTLTPVQQAVLQPDLEGRDLRISSQTGSGKTVAVGMVLAAGLELAAAIVEEVADTRPRACRPYAILIAPTRELAAQLARELTWLFEPLGVRVESVTGGTAYSGELRALRSKPLVITATPGRLLDHLERGSIDASAVGAVVLDEADQMLDLGFRDELEAILGKLPAERHTHLVSATFSREVLSLAARYQKNAAHIEGTKIGDAHEDIAHVIHLVRMDERLAALQNILLTAPGERTLVFVRTRADASDLADKLCDAGFTARALSGDLEQWERTKTLDAFRKGQVHTLVATDVAARGIDVPEVSRVVHGDVPGDSESYTHRSGRTGRAGRKGTSILLVPPNGREQVLRVLRRARVTPTFLPAPTPADVMLAADQRLRAELVAACNEPGQDERLRRLAADLLTTLDPVDVVATLLARSRHTGPCDPLPVTVIEPPAPRPAVAPRMRDDGPRAAGTGTGPIPFAPFRINYGARQGADARRLLALVCRRGDIRGNEVGAIHIGDTSSTFEVRITVAGGFAQAVQRPDPRDPHVRIEPLAQGAPRPVDRRGAPPKRPHFEPGQGFAPPRRAAAERWSE